MKVLHIILPLFLGTSACHAWIFSLQADSTGEGAESTNFTSLDLSSASEPTPDAGTSSTGGQSTSSWMGDTLTRGSTSEDSSGSASSSEFTTTTSTTDSRGGTTGVAAECAASSDDINDHSDGCDGDKPVQLIFTSSIKYSGDLGGLEGGDMKCNELAKTANLRGVYRAWLGVTGESVRARMESSPLREDNRELVRTDGEKVADDWAAFLDGWWGECEKCLSDKELPLRLRYDETGSQISDQDDELLVWSGAFPDGTNVDGPPDWGSQGRCLDWTSDAFLFDIGAMLAVWGNAGYAKNKNGRWSFGYARYCSEKLRLVCVQYSLE